MKYICHRILLSQSYTYVCTYISVRDELTFWCQGQLISRIVLGCNQIVVVSCISCREIVITNASTIPIYYRFSKLKCVLMCAFVIYIVRLQSYVKILVIVGMHIADVNYEQTRFICRLLYVKAFGTKIGILLTLTFIRGCKSYI